MSYVDLHLHLLPGVDDGPRDVRESLEHAARMVRDGVREAVVTPHVGHPVFAVDSAEIAPRTRALQQAIDRAGIALRLRAGGEIHPSAAESLTEDELEAIAQGPANARWVLVEVPFSGIDARFLRGCAAIRSRGFGLVIAHPERAAGLLDDGLQHLRAELAAGSVLQVNVCSLLGHHGPEAQQAGAYLVRKRLASLLASDGHAGNRRHTLRRGFDLALAAGAPPLQAWQLTQANPRLLLRDGITAESAPAHAALDPRDQPSALSRRAQVTRVAGEASPRASGLMRRPARAWRAARGTGRSARGSERRPRSRRWPGS